MTDKANHIAHQATSQAGTPGNGSPAQPHASKPELSPKSKQPLLFSFRGRMLVLAILMLLPCPLIIARLYELQVIRHQEFTDLVKAKQQRIIITPPVRGQIYSADGKILARTPSEVTLLTAEGKWVVGYVPAGAVLLRYKIK